MSLFTTFKDTTKKPCPPLKPVQKKASSSTLLNLPGGFKVETLFATHSSVQAQIRTTSRIGICPVCSHRSFSVHSTYVRTIQDLGICGRSNVYQVSVFKFYCKNSLCLRKIFNQDISTLSKRYGRNSLRVEKQITQTSLETSCGKSSYLLHSQNVHISPSTCLRRVLSLPIPSMCSVHHIAIDDFAFKKGHTYGSAITDQLTGNPVEMLDGRDAETVEAFLEKNPQLLTISRDRAHCYSSPINRIMPHVTQVCDRFHLMKNFSDMMDGYIKSLSLKKNQQIMNEEFTYPSKEETYHLLRNQLFLLGTKRMIQKPQLYIKIHELMGRGLTVLQMSQQLGISSTMVYKYTQMTKIDHLLTLEQKTLLMHVGTIAEQISKGIIQTKELFKKLGPQVKQEWIARLTFQIRKEWKMKKQMLRKLKSKLNEKKQNKIPSKEIFKLFFEEGYRTTCEPLEDMLTQHPKLKGLRTICIQFRDMMNRRNTIELRKWLDNTYNYGIPVLKKFSQGLIADQQAVQEAVDCQWSNGLAEGTVNRIKNIKRQMYGRAGFELLKRKIILAKWG